MISSRSLLILTYKYRVKDGTKPRQLRNRPYQNLCVALDAITAKKNEEAFNK